MNRTMPKHIKQRLTYALNNVGEFVGIDDVPTGSDCNCFCPACKEPLVAKNGGTKRVHHFAHQSGTECAHAVESMLHLLAKEKVREAFLSQPEYWIEFEYRSYCSKIEECNYYRYGECYVSHRERVNLKDYYDSCEQEIAYDNINRRSDLKIFSSITPDRKPIYLEFCVTHASDVEKLHSGNKIIEIKIATEDDILRLVQDGIVESEISNTGLGINNENALSKVYFYGFKNADDKNNSLNEGIEFVRYILYKSGKTQCFQDSCSCKNLIKSTPFSLFEMCIHTPISDIIPISSGIYEQVKYIGFRKYGIPNCMVCRNYVNRYNGMGKICCVHKQLRITEKELSDFDTARAKTCSSFQVNQQDMESAIKKILSRPYTVFKI